MNIRADQRLFLSYLILIGFLTIILSVSAGSLLRPRLMRSFEDDLRRELLLARAIYETDQTMSPDSAAWLIGRLTDRGVTIIDAEGRAIGVAGELEEARAALGGYRARPEVRAAFELGEGRAVRRPPDSDGDRMFLAVASSRESVVRLDASMAGIDAGILAIRRQVLTAGAFAALLAAIFSYVFSLYVTRPLRHIGEVARALAAGDLTRRVRLRREDDLGELGSALDKLAEELQKRLGQLEDERAETQALIDSMSEGVLAFTATGALRRANPAARRIFALGNRPAGISAEVVSRRADFLELVALALDGHTVPPRELAGDGRPLLATAHPLPDGGAVLVFLDISELRRLEGVRRDFVANASHELKTPLTAIRGFSETLMDPSLPPELSRKFAEIVKQNADRLQQIVDDLLDLSRIEAGGWRLESSVVSVGDLAAAAWSAQLEGRPDNGIELRLAIDETCANLHADPHAVTQIFNNLFSNAVRYTPPGGSVTVAATPGTDEDIAKHPATAPEPPSEAWVLIEVTDTGSGIPGPHLKRVFERFYRADPARSREEGGTGLGLAIVKHLVESHGGWIEADSQVGVGTTIRFLLPGAGPPS